MTSTPQVPQSQSEPQVLSGFEPQAPQGFPILPMPQPVILSSDDPERIPGIS